MLLQLPRAQVRCQNNDGVAKIDCVPQTVRQLTILKNLQQDVVHVWVSFFNLIQKNYGIGRPADAFRQLTTFFIANVSRGRADQFRDGMFLHVLGHIETNQRFFTAEQKFGQAASDFCFAHARWPEEQEASHRTSRSLQARAAAADRPGQRRYRLILANHAAVQFLFNAQQLLLLIFLNRRNLNTGPARDDFFDVFA